MKKLLLSLASALMLTACGAGSLLSGGTKMDTTEATTKVVECLKKNIDFNEWKVYDLRWSEGETLENDLLMVRVEMINTNNSCFSQVFHVGGSIAGTVGDLSEARGIGIKELTFAGVKGITPEMINPEAIQKQYDAAKTMIPEQYEFKSIGDYQFNEIIPSGNSFLDRNKKIGKIVVSFDVCVTEKGKEIVKSAGKESIQYYEVQFDVQPDGSVIIHE